MGRKLDVRFRVEAGLAAVSGVLFLLTLFWRGWIEAVSGYDPDRHNGSAEWLLAATLLAATLVLGLIARTDWKKHVEGAPQAT